MVNVQNVKGFQDKIGVEAIKRKWIKEIVGRSFEAYGFEPAETPVIESEEFVKGDNARDDAVRDVYILEDRAKRKLALRFEFTFQLKRIAKGQKLPYKRYQIGEVFRDEPIRAGRSRQFTQMDADVIGSTIKDEAECIKILNNIFSELEIPVVIYINNRKLINEILVEQKIRERDRGQIIRELDKLDKLSEKEVADNLKKFGAEKLVKLFKQSEKAFEKYNFYKEIKELKIYCKNYGVDVEFRPFLARGLSYYNGSVFEVWSSSKSILDPLSRSKFSRVARQPEEPVTSKELNVSLCGGGSYLANDIQSTGISIGLEPVSLLCKKDFSLNLVQVISLGQDKEAIRICESLRDKGRNVFLILDKTVGKAMEYANSKNVSKVIFVGGEEVKKKKFKVRDMKSGKESLLSEGELVKEIC